MNNFNYMKLTPFKWFVLENFPFIEADFDALTEWQLFCKLGKEMNKIINSENTLGTQVENLTNAFIELQKFVNDYFDNLDVQEEINNKLNEMAVDGTLQNIILNYVSVSKVYNTTIEMIEDAENLSNNMKVKTLGYHEINDDGYAEFLITNVLDNTKFNIPVGNLYAQLLTTNSSINIKQMGAYGDGEHDDTLIIQKALDLYFNVFIPIGEFLITDTLKLRNYNKIFGINSKKSLIIANTNITMFSKLGETSYYNIFENVGIDGENMANIGIDFTNIRESYINNVNITGCYTGLRLDNAWSNTIFECNIYANLTENIYLGNVSNDVNIIDCKLDLAGQYGININGNVSSNMINIDGCVIQQAGITGIYLINATLINISNCYFENNNTTENVNGYDIYINASTVSVINLMNNSFYFKNTHAGVYVQKAKEIMINNIYGGRNDLTKQFNIIEISDTVSLQHLYLFGLGLSDNANILIKDDNNKITNFSASNVIFKNGINISKAYPTFVLNSLETGNPELIMQADGTRIFRQYTNRNTKVGAIEKINNDNNTMEELIQFTATNTIIPKKAIRSEFQMYGRIQSHYGTTANRPESPLAGEIYLDTTLGKPIFYKGTAWVDATGATV